MLTNTLQDNDEVDAMERALLRLLDQVRRGEMSLLTVIGTDIRGNTIRQHLDNLDCKQQSRPSLRLIL